MMIKSPFKVRLCCTLLVLNLLFIWGNSLMPAAISSAFSQWVKELLEWLFPGGNGDSAPGDGEHLLRKLAHFTEFCLLGIWLCWLHFLTQSGKPRLVLPLLGGFAVACVDEIIQAFVPGRSPGFLDVGIDTLGVILGIVLISLIHTLYYRVHNVKEKKL